MTNTVLVYLLWAASIATTWYMILVAPPRSYAWVLAFIGQFLWVAFLLIAGPRWTAPLIVISAFLALVYVFKTFCMDALSR